MPIGTLRKYRDAGGYGFADTKDGQSVFCHISKLREGGIDQPVDGMVLQFDVMKKNGAKWMATNIRLIESDG